LRQAGVFHPAFCSFWPVSAGWLRILHPFLGGEVAFFAVMAVRYWQDNVIKPTTGLAV
jgi:cytochrome b subunit of formate dehydrogenase